MKYRIKVVKVTSPNTERPVADFDIEKIEVKGLQPVQFRKVKIKFLPTLKQIKDAIVNDIFRD